MISPDDCMVMQHLHELQHLDDCIGLRRCDWHCVPFGTHCRHFVALRQLYSRCDIIDVCQHCAAAG